MPTEANMVPPRTMPSQHTRPKSASTLLATRSNNRHPAFNDMANGQIYRETDVKIERMPISPVDHQQMDIENMDPADRLRDRKPGLHRRSKSAVSLRSLVNGDTKKQRDKTEKSPNKKPKKEKGIVKTKSSTGLANMFSKLNKSSKNLAATPNDEPIDRSDNAMTTEPRPRSPRVRPDATLRQLQHVKTESDRYTPSGYSPSKQRNFRDHRIGRDKSPSKAPRPKSLIVTATRDLGEMLSRQGSGGPAAGADRSQLSSRGSDSSCTSRDTVSRFSMDRFRQTPSDQRKTSSSSSEQPSPSKARLNNPKRQSRVMAAVAAIDAIDEKDRQAVIRDCRPPPPKLSPKEIEEAFEAVLETRNIPQDQRQKMRTLTVHVKADFVKQDQAIRTQSGPIAGDEHTGNAKTNATTPQRSSFDEKAAPATADKTQSKRSRPRSKTFTFSILDTSPSKKQKATARPLSVNNSDAVQKGMYGLASPSSVSVSKQTQPSTVLPNEFVTYLRTTRDPVEAEVGRLHKLRLLLRNETVAWVDEFVRLGGMNEVACLLHRIMAIEWREDHEDQLLHETLLCLKGLCTTEVALQQLDDLADGLLPPLIHLIFDEERKGPSEFTTRGIVFSVLFAYLGARIGSSETALEERAHKILGFLEGPSKDQDTQAVSFVLDMRVRRPYKIWCKEVTNVLKEVFWIFLHHGNVVALPDQATKSSTADESEDVVQATPSAVNTTDSKSYTERHFPRTRAPTPAAPYIGGVEWDATTYIATHLDLINALLASLPTRQARNSLRTDLQASGFEKIMGNTLRTCKEKFYACVHDGLRTWVGAAVDDGWDTEFVRCGPSLEQRAECAVRALNGSPARRKAEEAGGKGGGAAPPQLEDVPKLELGFEI